MSSDLAITSWSTDELSAVDRCGHCDNCTRPPEDIKQRDVTAEAWKLLKILESVNKDGGRLTIAGLSDVARGAHGGGFEAGGRRGSPKRKVCLDYDAIAGGTVALSKYVRACLAFLVVSHVNIISLQDTEVLVVQMLTSQYLGESFSSTSYATNVYIIPGELAIRLSRFGYAQIVNGEGPRIRCSFRIPRKGKIAPLSLSLPSARTIEADISSDDEVGVVAGPSSSCSSQKPRIPRKRLYHELDEESVVAETEGFSFDVGTLDDGDDDIRMIDDDNDGDDDDDEERGWKYSIRQTRSRRQDLATPKRMRSGRVIKPPTKDVICLSSD